MKAAKPLKKAHIAHDHRSRHSAVLKLRRKTEDHNR